MSRLLSSAAIVALAALSLAADWPQFRGSDRTNISPDKGLLKKWPDGGPKLAWKATGLGTGFSSVSIKGDRLFTMGNKDGKASLFAIDRTSGKTLWESKIGGQGTGGGNRNWFGARSTPPTDGERVYGLAPTGELVCLDVEKGNEIWSKSLKKDFGGQQHSGWEYSESPLLDGDRLICVPGGKTATMVALDKKTGKDVWKAPIGDAAGYSSVVISNAGGIKQYVVLTGNGTIGVEAATGKLLWRHKLDRNTANIPTPVILDNQVLTAVGYGKGTWLLNLSKDGDGIKMKDEWHKTELTNKHGGVLVVGDYVFGDSSDRGDITCAEWKTGKVIWKKGRVGKGGGSASLTYADGHLYINFANGQVSLVPAMAKEYKEVGTFRVPGTVNNSWAHPVVLDGKLYVRVHDNLYCYDVKE